MSTFRKILFSRKKIVSGGGGGGSSGFTFIASSSQVGTTGNTISPAIDTTGATDLFVLITGGSGSTPSISDNNSNSWNIDVPWSGHYMIYHSVASLVGSGHFVTVGNVSGCNVVFIAFSKSGGAILDGSPSTPGSTGNWNGSTVRAGSLTPSTANNLFLALAWWDVGAGGAGDTVDSGFTKITAIGINPGLGAAYKIKSSDSTAENPGWVHIGAADGFFIQVCYK